MGKLRKQSRKTSSAFAFPKGFLWGAATAAHQVEGDNVNNWSEWEKITGKIVDGSVSGSACDHYRRFEKDFSTLAALGHSTHRFSIEWSRLEPRQGEWDMNEFKHYRNVLLSLAKKSIKPMVTLHHFTNPLWFESMGAFEHPESPFLFNRLVAKAAQELGSLCDLWCTINEPSVYAYLGYVLGKWPPGKSSIAAARRVLINLLIAHGEAYHTLHKQLGEKISVGIAKHFRVFDPRDPKRVMDRQAARLYDRIFNRLVLTVLTRGILLPPLALGRRISICKNTLDFLGINYYTRDLVGFSPTHPGSMFASLSTNPDAPRNSLGWEIYPQGLYRTIMSCVPLGLPLYITENGIAVTDDKIRCNFLFDHLKAVHRAIAHGADMRGYYYWSSHDNFEWAEGYTARFGLIDVDRAAQKRTVHPSARLYATIARRNSLP